MKLFDINDIMSDKLRPELNNLSHKYVDICNFKNKIKEAISVCEKIGSSKSFIAGLKDDRLNIIFESNEIGHLLDENNYDHLPEFNDINDELKSKLLETISSLDIISEQLLKTCQEKVKEFNEVGNEYALLAKEYFTKQKKELSNTSNEVIPSLAREVELQHHLVKNIGGLDVGSPEKSLTIDELNLKRDDVFGLADQILGSIKIKEVPSVGLSEKPDELLETISGILNEQRINQSKISSTMSLIEKFKSCC